MFLFYFILIFFLCRFGKSIENLSEDTLGYQNVSDAQSHRQTAVKRGDPVFTQHQMGIHQHLTPTVVVWVEDLIMQFLQHTLPMWVPVHTYTLLRRPLHTSNITKQVLRHSTVIFPEDLTSLKSLTS